jgi:hypothetical protein
MVEMVSTQSVSATGAVRLRRETAVAGLQEERRPVRLPLAAVESTT